MRAILLKRGRLVHVYTLEIRGRNEVVDFLDDPADKSTEGYRNGLWRLINIIADEKGYDLHRELFKCWGKKRNKICEIRKGPFRIGCFKYPESRLLLVTVFQKQKPKEHGEYDRAFGYKQRFDEVLDWSD